MNNLRPMPTAQTPVVKQDGTLAEYEYWFGLDKKVRESGNVGVPSSREIATGAGLTGGGNLSADRTISVQFGTAVGTVAEGNDARIVGAAQASSLGSAAYAETTDFDGAGSASNAVAAHVASADPHPQYLTSIEGSAAFQPIDSDLTAIAGLSTMPFGRSLLEAANAAALRVLAETVIGTDVVAQSHVGAGGTAHANVVASGAAGFMTGADKTKLDGITSGADVTSSVFGSWTSYTPTVTAGSGSFTSASATGAYLQIGKMVFFRQSITLTTIGTAGFDVEATLPTAVVGSISCSGKYVNVGKSLQSEATGATTGRTYSRLFDGSFPFTDGAILVVSGFYERP